MSSEPLDDTARALLQAVVTGERALEDPEVTERRRRDPAFARRLDGLRTTAELLDRAGAEVRDIGRAAEGLQDAPGEQRLRRVLENPGGGRTRTGLRRVLWTGAAAAGIAVALFVSRERRPAAEREPLWMGGDAVHILHPRGQVDSYVPIHWAGRLPPRGEYRITIEDATLDAAGLPALLQHRTTDTRWTPAPEDLSLLGQRIRVDVSIFVDGQRLEGDSSVAQR